MSAQLKIPAKTNVLVVGGGPGGSYVATVLKREGFDVVLLEAAQFPRYHIGEGMLPSMRHYLNYIGCLEKFEKHGFMHKPGAAFKLSQGLRETWTDFTSIGPNQTTWNVIRSQSDELLLRHAETEGVKVFESTRVDSIQFDGDVTTSRPVSATWTSKSSIGGTGTIAFDWLVDASGRAGIMSTKYLKNREFRKHLRNVAVWGYFRNVKIYAQGTKRSNSPWFEAMSDCKGWSWLIPLHDGTTSIGVVMHEDISREKKAAYPSGSPTLTEHFLEQLKFLPGVQDFLSDGGYLVEGSVKGSSDYSYFAHRYSGDHYRIIGDAANFVDPFFSSGVHVAFTGAMSAAITICASTKKQIEEKQAQLWHDAKLGISHTRFLFVVLGAYRQMKHQNLAVLTDVDGDSFDSAFALFQPVIMGNADKEPKLTNEKIEKIMDYCANVFDPTVGVENIMAVRQRYDSDYVSFHGPILAENVIKELTPGDDEATKVMNKLNALRVLKKEIDFSALENDAFNNYVAITVRGQVGLSLLA